MKTVLGKSLCCIILGGYIGFTGAVGLFVESGLGILAALLMAGGGNDSKQEATE